MGHDGLVDSKSSHNHIVTLNEFYYKCEKGMEMPMIEH